MAKQKAQPSSLLRQLVPQAVRQRVEGFELPMSTRVDGDVTTVGVDISNAPVPQREFAAEACTVIKEANEAWLIFTQAVIGTEGAEIDAMLIVRMNPQAARQLAHSVNDMKRPTVREIADRMGVAKAAPLDLLSRPRQTGRMMANLAVIAVSGYESCIDFYRASPFAFRDLSTTSKLAVEPVVRVDLQTAQFLTLIERLGEVVASLPSPTLEDDHGIQ
jgi:hypothetical protein